MNGIEINKIGEDGRYVSPEMETVILTVSTVLLESQTEQSENDDQCQPVCLFE